VGFDWKKVLTTGINVAGVMLPGGKVKDNILDNVVSIIDSETTDNSEATKLTAAAVDALAKEVKKLRADVDSLKKGKAG
jgi:hypothetical protein